MNASGAFAVHFASTSGLGSPFLVGRSRYSGGFFGSGDQAAALASCARAKNVSLTESSGVFTDSRALSISEFDAPGCRADKQHGLMMYKLPNTSACFMPMRVAPYPPIEWPAKPRLSRCGSVR